MTETAIRIEDLTRDFSSIRALDSLSLEMSAGTIFGFLGPNGAGKTTTINLLLGLLDPTDGRVEVLGFDTRTHADQVRARTGALLEHSGLYEQLSGEDNLEFYGRIWRLPTAERRARIKELLTQMGVWERRKERVGKWSRGMKQKLALARALLHRPPLVLLDEPTAGLDVVAASAVRDNLTTLAAQEGVAVFLTTHNMAEAERLCDEVAVIRDGRLVAVGEPRKLQQQATTPRAVIVARGITPEIAELARAHPGVMDVEIGKDRLSLKLEEATDTAPLVSQLIAAGIEIEEVVKDKASLEDVFLRLMEEEE
jgi:ABC-2 type transport system ATP-binding protein